MRPPLPAAKALALLVLASLVAGCSGGGDEGNGDGVETGPGTLDSDSTRSPIPFTNDPQERFAVLVVEGLLTGEGPEEGEPKVACSIAAPDGAVDVDAGTLWAQPGNHSFKAGKTWIVVVDRVAVDDPRGGSNGCRVPAAATPFLGEALWAPQLAGEPFHVRVYGGDGDDLLVGKNAVAPEATFRTQVAFEDGEHAFSGELAFTHAGWWPNSAFGERQEQPPGGNTAVWWG
jgi:hypothetical protein